MDQDKEMIMKRSILSLLMSCSLAFAGCSLEDDDTRESQEQQEPQESQESHAILADPAEAAAFSATSEIGIEACEPSYDADVAAVRNYIQNNCGGITTCGGIETFNHSDVFIGGNYCDCYTRLWNNRATGSFSKVQVIYHENSACPNTKHIHIEKKTNGLCGRIHYDVDEGTDGDCKDNEPSSKWDRWFGGDPCRIQHDSLIGTCTP
jgi:hypothetical protein